MKIQRERLLLVAALIAAAAACTAKATSNPSSDGGAPAVDAGGTTHDSAPAATFDSGHDSAVPIEVGDAGLLNGWDGGCLTNGGGDFTNCAPFEIVVAEGGAPIETDDGGPPCVTLNFCESLSALDTAVASQALACESRDFTTSCVDTTPCVIAALSVACPASSAAATCAPVVAACADAGVSDGGPGVITAAACAQVVSGFNATTIQTLTSCLSTSCNVATCVGNLF
jgi:hypothetical protein